MPSALDALIFNRAQLAQIYKVNLSTVTKWIQRGLPCVEVGNGRKAYQFQLQDVNAWLLEYQKQQKIQPQFDKTLQDLKKEILEEELAIKKLERMKAFNEVALVDDLNQELMHQYTHLRAKLFQIPERALPYIKNAKDDQAIKSAIFNEIRSAVIEFRSELDDSGEASVESDSGFIDSAS